MNPSNNNRRKYFFANKIHRDMFLLVFLGAALPILITAVTLYYLIFNVTIAEVGFPEAIYYQIFPAARKVLLILSVVLPAASLVILVFAYKVTHRMVGPYDRILRELGEIIEGKRTGPIVLRNKDKFSPLVDRINKILAINGKMKT